MSAIQKQAKACARYFGNVCSGFGAPLTCLTCGWDLMEHPDPGPAPTAERTER